MKVLDYHYNKLRFYKQRLNSLYKLSDVQKHYEYNRYQDLIKVDRKAIRSHIAMIREVKKLYES